MDFIKQSLQDVNHNPSSKRLCGAVIIFIWILLNIFIILYDVFSPMELTSATVTLLENMGWVGFGLLGVSVFEFFSKGKNE